MSLFLDSTVVANTGAFAINELERLDQTLNLPLMDFTWSRDISVRTDVTMGDTSSSYTNSDFASSGGLSATGKRWISDNGNVASTVQLSISKTNSPLTNWGEIVSYSVFELEQALQLGRPIDTQKIAALVRAYQRDIDEQVYMGDTEVGVKGLLNNTAITAANVAAGTGGLLWSQKTPQEILADVREIETATWTASGYAVAPTDLRLSPSRFVALLQPLSIGGNTYNSILTYLAQNSVCMAKNGKPLNIQPVKWLETAGAGGTNRMVAYTNDYMYSRFPLVPMQRSPISTIGINHSFTYYAKLGVVELPYGANTISYRDGL